MDNKDIYNKTREKWLKDNKKEEVMKLVICNGAKDKRRKLCERKGCPHRYSHQRFGSYMIGCYGKTCIADPKEEIEVQCVSIKPRIKKKK